MSDDLESLRQKKLAELQDQMQSQAQSQAHMQQQLEQVEAVIKTRLSKEALSRYGNIKAAHPEKFMQLLAVLAQLIQQKSGTIEDATLKKILIELDQKKDIKITRK